MSFVDAVAMNLYRLRVELPVQPIAPTRVADALDAVGGRIIAVDLREVDGTNAIDEIVVELPDASARDALHTVLREEQEATLLSSQTCTTDEPIRHAREWARMSNDPRALDAGTDLAERVSSACPLSRAVICSAPEAASVPPASMALRRGRPVAHRSTTLPDSRLGRGDSPVWLLAVPDRYPDVERIALVARPTSLRFTSDEVARVEMLMTS